MVDVMLDYEKGLNPYYGLTDIAINMVFLKVSTRIELPDGERHTKRQLIMNPKSILQMSHVGN